MKLLIIGDSAAAAEAREKFGNKHEYLIYSERPEAEEAIDEVDVVFDFSIDTAPDEFEIYAERKAVVFLNTVKISLSELCFYTESEIRCTIFGFNGLPSLFNRTMLEVSLRQSEDKPALDRICSQLITEFVIVDDRVGMVTPRVICMIINEAFYTVQEKTASREDIDVAMKLGTNYPFGPFEWCDRIGIKNVYETLEAVYEDMKDERYKICPLLKKEYLSTT